MLVLSRKPNERIMIGNDVILTVLSAKGQQIRLGFEAPQNIEIHRHEIFEKIQQEKANAHSTEHEAD